MKHLWVGAGVAVVLWWWVAVELSSIMAPAKSTWDACHKHCTPYYIYTVTSGRCVCDVEKITP